MQQAAAAAAANNPAVSSSSSNNTQPLMANMAPLEPKCEPPQQSQYSQQPTTAASHEQGPPAKLTKLDPSLATAAVTSATADTPTHHKDEPMTPLKGDDGGNGAATGGGFSSSSPSPTPLQINADGNNGASSVSIASPSFADATVAAANGTATPSIMGEPAAVSTGN